MNNTVSMNRNELVAYLEKPAAEFTKADIIRYIKENEIEMVNFMYPAGDGRLKTLNFVINDAAYIAESFLRAYDTLWKPLDEVTKKRYLTEFAKLRHIDPPYTNWLLFSSTIESFMAKAGGDFDEYRVNSACRKVEEWYVGDGWYADGPDFHHSPCCPAK